MGAAFGRLVGEIMALIFPNGISFAGHTNPIVPGGYAVVGAAAFSGAVTHTISTTVIVFELTGQLSHIIPVIIAVLIANAIAQSLFPSIYDSIIQIKKLPFLPNINSTSSAAHSVQVEDIMVRDIIYVWQKCTYNDTRKLLKNHRSITSFPLVDSPRSMILLGSVQRAELQLALSRYLSRERRLLEIERRTLPLSKIEHQQEPQTTPVQMENVIVNMPDMKPVTHVEDKDHETTEIEVNEEPSVDSSGRRMSRFDVTRVQPVIVGPPASAPPALSSQQIKFTLNPSTSVSRCESASPDPSGGNTGIPLKSILRNNSPSCSYPGNSTSSALYYGIYFVFLVSRHAFSRVYFRLSNLFLLLLLVSLSCFTDSKKLKHAFDSWFKGRTLSNNKVISSMITKALDTRVRKITKLTWNTNWYFEFSHVHTMLCTMAWLSILTHVLLILRLLEYVV